MTTWREVATQALRSAGPTKHDKAEAMKEAGRRWRAMKGGGSDDGYRSNPGKPNVLLIAGGIVAALIGVNYLQKMQTPPALPAPDPVPTNVTNNVPFMWSTNSSAR